MADLQAIIQRVEFPDDSQAHVYLIVTDGQQKAEIEVFTSSLDDLKAQARRVLTNITQAEALKALTVGEVLDLTAAVGSPTPLQAFVAHYQNVQSALRKVAAGVVAADAPEVTSLLAETIKAYTPEFLSVA